MSEKKREASSFPILHPCDYRITGDGKTRSGESSILRRTDSMVTNREEGIVNFLSKFYMHYKHKSGNENKRNAAFLLSDQQSEEHGNLEADTDKIVIDENIVMEIFLRLPVKSLHRCKLLSKKLLFFISSDFFRGRYAKFSRTNSSPLMLGFFCQAIDIKIYGSAPIHFIPSSPEGVELMKVDNKETLGGHLFDQSLSFILKNDGFDAKRTRLYIVASSNGFILCKKDCSLVNCSMEVYYYVCNPVTTEWVALPNSPQFTLEAAFEVFVCHGDIYPCLESVTYKVVRGFDIKTCYLEMEIYSSHTGQWVQLHLHDTVGCALADHIASVPVISEKEIVCLTAYCGSGSGCIVFNVNETQNFKTIRYPRPEYVNYIQLGHSQGSIYLTCIYCECFDVWELCEEIWVLKYKPTLQEIFPGVTSGAYFFLAFHPLDSAVILVHFEERFMLFNIENKSVDFLSEFPDSELYHCIPYQWHCWPPRAV